MCPLSQSLATKILAVCYLIYPLADRSLLAVEVSHNGQAIFHSNGFEDGTTGLPTLPSSGGAWTTFVPSQGGTIKVVDDKKPGAFAGKNYFEFTRNADSSPKVYVYFGEGFSEGTLSARWYAFIPSGSDVDNNQLVAFSDHSMSTLAGVALSGDKNIRIRLGNEWKILPLHYQTDKWQEWQLNYEISTGRLEVSINGETQKASGQVANVVFDRLVVINGDQSGTKFYLDSDSTNDNSRKHSEELSWRNDNVNLRLVAKINKTIANQSFSAEIPGTLDKKPVCIDWSTGPDLPLNLYWKGGVAGVIDNKIILTGGLWMTKRLNLTLSYNPAEEEYDLLPQPPTNPSYTQGACDGKSIYVVGGRSSKTNVYRLTKDNSDNWIWNNMASLPAADEAGRWLGSVGIIPGKWLLLVGGIGGYPPGLGSAEGGPKMPDYRLKLDDPNAQWESMAEYPAGSKHLMMGAVVGHKFYLFGGTPGMQVERHAYVYDAEANTWTAIKDLPLPRSGGATVVVDNRYILLMGAGRTDSLRYGGAAGGWIGYSDEIIGYDIAQDNYFRVGVLPYGIGTSPWVKIKNKVYSFGGEPQHNINDNTENVLQIGTLNVAPSKP